jgi:hypothetical protein
LKKLFYFLGHKINRHKKTAKGWRFDFVIL